MKFTLTKTNYNKNYLDEIIDDIFTWCIKNIHKGFEIVIKEGSEIVACLKYENLWHFLYEEPYTEYFSEKFLKVEKQNNKLTSKNFVDFENRICGNCKYYKEEGSYCENEENEVFEFDNYKKMKVPDWKFGCNRFERRIK